MMAKNNEIDSPIFSIVVKKMIAFIDNNTPQENVIVKLSKEELLPIIGEERFDEKLREEGRWLSSLRNKDGGKVRTVFFEISWNNNELYMEFSKDVIPYLLDGTENIE